MNLCSYNPKTRNERRVMPVHHGFFLLFQFCEDFIGTHAFGKQLFQNGLCFCLFCFFCSFGICLRLLCFQLDNFLVDSFQRCFLLFQVSFQSVMFAVMDAISAVSASFADCFSAICVAKSAVTVLGLFLLPFVLGIGYKPLSNYNN